MQTMVVKRPENEKMTMVQTNLSNRLHTLASRTMLSNSACIEYWETYVGYMREYRFRMGIIRNKEAADRCDDTIRSITQHIAEMKDDDIRISFIRA